MTGRALMTWNFGNHHNDRKILCNDFFVQETDIFRIRKTCEESRTFITCLYKLQLISVDSCHFTQPDLSLRWLDLHQTLLEMAYSYALVPSIIGKDHGQILMECAHHSYTCAGDIEWHLANWYLYWDYSVGGNGQGMSHFIYNYSPLEGKPSNLCLL